MQKFIFQFLLILITINVVSFHFDPEQKFTKIPKEQRIEGMAEQEFEMIRDTKTNTIPREQILKVKEQIENNVYRSGNTFFWEERGPDNVGGRTRTMAFDPGDSSGNTIWSGGVAGGLWKLTNAFSANYSWERIKSYTGNSAISSIVIDPSNHDVIYVGTGEGWFNADAYRGDGVYRSLDGGRTWSRLPSTANGTFVYIQKLLISKDRLFACTRDGGIQMSLDRGETWVKSLGNGQWGFSERAADIELASDGTLYAGMGFRGSSDGIYKSNNNGDTWEYLPMPGYFTNRVDLAVAPSDPNIVYVLKETLNTGAVEEIAKTVDGGLTWELLESPPAAQMDFFTRGQAWYDLSITIDPRDANRVYIGGVDILLTEDGGANWDQVSHWYGGFNLQYVHADQHFAGFLDETGKKAIFTNDGGIYVTENADASDPLIEWKNQGYNTVQFYACALHPTDENYFLGGTQDNGTYLFEEPSVNSAFRVTGGDGAYCHIDRDNPDIQITSYVYNNYYVTTNAWQSDRYYNLASNKGYFINPTDYDDDNDVLICSSQQGEVIVMDVHTGEFDSIKISQINEQRVTAIKVHPNDNTKVYIGTNGGTVILVNNLLREDRTVEEIYGVGGFVRSIDIDLNNDERIMFVISNMNLRNVYLSEDDGENWVVQDGDLPSIPVRWGVFNPANPNGIILGTELGIWSTSQLAGEDDTEWIYNNIGLAPTRVDMLDVRASDFTVLAATHGRGMFSTNVCSGAIDNDGDGFTCEDDCNDFDSSVNADATETPYNGIDDDCDPTTLDDDLDQDGFVNADDCDDQDPAINPDADEIADNGVDENCDGLDQEPPCGDTFTGPWDIFGGNVMCENGWLISEWELWSNEAYFVSGLEVNEIYFFDFCTGYDPSIFQTNTSIYYYNQELAERGDLISSSALCNLEFEYMLNTDFPDILIIVHDILDCNAESNLSGNGVIRFGCLGSGVDSDGDGFPDNLDCDDQNPSVNSAVTEILFNGIDDDCDPSTLDNDLDGDGWGLDEDCDESNPNINPGAEEIPGNGIDEDCDGLDGPSAVHELGGVQLNVFPNPTTGDVFIQGSDLLNLKLELFSGNGKLIRSVLDARKIDLNAFENGTYMLVITDLESGKRVVEKIVLMK